MGFAFTIGPFFGMISGIAAAIWAVRRKRPGAAPVSAPSAESDVGRSGVAPRPWPKAIRVPLFAIIAGFAAYLAGIVVFWIFWPYSGSSFSPMGQFLWHAPAWIGVAARLPSRSARRGARPWPGCRAQDRAIRALFHHAVETGGDWCGRPAPSARRG